MPLTVPHSCFLTMYLHPKAAQLSKSMYNLADQYPGTKIAILRCPQGARRYAVQRSGVPRIGPFISKGITGHVTAMVLFGDPGYIKNYP
ncbi:hypothetical protein VTO42DRAFT_7761 [Malbranchea cinnamomea]